MNLSKTLNGEEFDIVFSSDLTRAVESASIVFSYLSVSKISDSRVRECNYGELNGQDKNLVNYSEHIANPFPNGESLKDVENRICNFCKFLKENYDNKKVAIVAHRAPQLALDVITKKISWQEAIENDWRNTKNWKPGWDYVID